MVGDVGIHFVDESQCELGCTLRLESQGLGYAVETLRRILNYLFNELNKHRTIASIDPQNKKSIMLVDRLGFRKEGHFKQSYFLNGEWVDDAIYAILRSEWCLQNDSNLPSG